MRNFKESAGKRLVIGRFGACVLASAVTVTFAASAPAWAAAPTEAPDTRPFSLTPTVGLQESYTDNALLTASNRHSDFITRLMAGAKLAMREGRLQGSASGNFFYDRYANRGGLSGWSLFANGVGSYDIVSDFLALDVDGNVTNGYVSTFGTSAINRAGTVGRVQLSTYDVGPTLTTTVGHFADLKALARFSQVLYANADGSPNVVLPADSTIEQATAKLDTDDRFAGYQLRSVAAYERDDHGFELANFEQSAFVRLLPQLRLILRGGYERITEKNLIDISDPIWSAGFEVTINRHSKLSAEGGERYGHTNWTLNMLLQLSDRLFATARYSEALEPSQIRINSAYTSYLDNVARLPEPLIPANFTINGNLYNQASFDKTAEIRLAYKWDIQTLSASAQWSDRRFTASGAHDRTLISNLSYERLIHPDLTLNVNVNYAQTFASPLYGDNHSYGTGAKFIYAVNRTMNLNVGYAYQRQHQTSPFSQTITENVVFASIQKRF